jgi:hypothetical protein
MSDIDELSTDIYFDGSKVIKKVQTGGGFNINTEQLNIQLKSVINHMEKNKYNISTNKSYDESSYKNEYTCTSSNTSNKNNSYSDTSYSDKSYSDKSYSDKSYSDKSYSDKSYSDKSYSDKSYSDENYTNNSYSNNYKTYSIKSNNNSQKKSNENNKIHSSESNKKNKTSSIFSKRSIGSRNSYSESSVHVSDKKYNLKSYTVTDTSTHKNNKSNNKIDSQKYKLVSDKKPTK